MDSLILDSSRLARFASLLSLSIVMLMAPALSHADILPIPVPAATTSYPMMWGPGASFEPAPSEEYAGHDAGEAEGYVAGYMASFFPTHPLTAPWQALSPSTCATYGFPSCYGANFTGFLPVVGSECLAGGGPTTPGGDSKPGWCLIQGTATTPTCSTDPKDGQTYNTQTGTCQSGPERNAGGCSACQQVGNPINAGSGNKFETVTDYRGSGSFPLVYTRTYNSSVANEINSPGGVATGLGVGWSSNHTAGTGGNRRLAARLVGTQMVQCALDILYECPVNTYPINEVTISGEDGSEELFSCQVDLTGTCTFSPEPGSTGQLLMVNSGYQYLRTDGYTEIYDMTGILTAVQDPHGLRQTYAYTYTSGINPVLQSFTVTDPTGRYLQFNYDTVITDAYYGLLVAVNTPDGNIYYNYDSYDNLQTVTYPDLSVVTYEYNDSSLIHALTGLKDETGHEYAAWSYDDTSGKAICSEHAPSGDVASTATTCIADTGGVDKVVVHYNGDGSGCAHDACVTEPTGLVRNMTFTNVNGRYLLASVDVRCPTCGDTAQLISYDANGNLQSVTDFNGNVTDYSIDAVGLEQSRTEAVGTTFQRTIVTTWYTPSGGAEEGLPKSVTEEDATGAPVRVTSWCYNVSGSSCVDSSSIGSTWSKTITDPVNTSLLARTTTYTYNATGLLTSVDGPLTGLTDTTTYTYYTSASSGNYNANDLEEITDALGHSTQITQYSAAGLPRSVTDMNGVVTTFTYDARDRLLTKVVDAGGSDNMNLENATTTYTYNANGLLHTVALPTTASGHAYETYSYDRAHRRTSVGNDAGESKAFTYTYNTTAQTYDVEEQRFTSGGVSAVYTRHLTRVDAWNPGTSDYGELLDTDGNGNTTTSQLDPNGNVIAVTDPLSHVTTTFHDALNRIYEVVDANGSSVGYLLDALDRPLYVTTNTRGVTTAYTYDAFGELLSQNSADSGSTTYDYTNWLSHAKIVSARNGHQQQTYTYDAVGRLLSQSNGLSGFSYTYDNTASGANGIGRLHVASDISGSTTYSYDSHGNVKNKAISFTETGNSFSISYKHDGADGLISTLYPPSDGTVKYTLDALERPTDVYATYGGGPNEHLAGSITYMPFGPLSGLTYGNGLVETRSFDTAYRLTHISTPTVQDWSYGYNNDGTISGITDNITNGNSQSFTYDPMQRLVIASGAYGSISIGSDPVHHPELSYDADGNRTQITVGSVTTTYNYDTTTPSERLVSTVKGGTTTTYGYDTNGDGSIISDGTYTYNYDINDRNTKVLLGTTVEYQAEYNFLGQRSAKIVGTTDNDFAYDEQGHLVAELNTDGSIMRQHVWLGDREIAYYNTNINGSTLANVKYLHVDQTNTPKIMTNSTAGIGWSWNPDPWGNNSATLPSNYNGRFPGQYYDSQTGNMQNWMRDFDPQTGRYLQSDPIGLRGGINSYIYALNNPERYFDPYGLATQFAAGIGGAVIVPGFGISASFSVGVDFDGWNSSVYIQDQFNAGIGLGAFAGYGVQAGASNGPAPTTGFDSAKYGELDGGDGGLSASLDKCGNISFGGNTGIPRIRVGEGAGLGGIVGNGYTATAVSPSLEDILDFIRSL